MTLLARVLVPTLVGFAAAGQLVHLDALYWNWLGGAWSGRAHPAYLTVVVGDAVLSAATGGLALALAFDRRRGRGRSELALGLSAWSYMLAYSGIVALLRPESPGSPLRVLFDAHFPLIEALGLAGLLAFTYRFPGPLPLEALSPPAELPVGLGTAQRLRRFLGRPWAPWAAGGLVTAAAWAVTGFLGRPLAEAPLTPVLDVARLATLSVVVANLRTAYLAAGPADRRRVHWVAVGFALLLVAVGMLVGLSVLTAVTGWRPPRLNWRPVVLDAGVLGLLWGAGMGVLYEGRLQPGAVGRAALRLAVTVTAGLLLAAGLEALFSGAVGARLALPRGAGTAVAAIVTWVVHGWIRGPLDRLLAQEWTSGGAAGEAGATPTG